MSDEYMATLVSIVPFPIRERVTGIYPGVFDLPAYEEPISTPVVKMRPKVLSIGESKHFVPIGSDRPDIAVNNSPLVIAKAVVQGYIESMIEVGDGAVPGFFYLTGKVSSEEVATKFTDKLKTVKDKQINWFKNLLKSADDDWSKYHKHTVISDLQRVVAQLMGYNKEWLSVVDAKPPIKCPICLSAIDADCVVCPNCKVILKKDVYALHQFATNV